MSARWFTDPAAAGPASIFPSFTEFEKLHFAAIIEFACNQRTSIGRTCAASTRRGRACTTCRSA